MISMKIRPESITESLSFARICEKILKGVCFPSVAGFAQPIQDFIIGEKDTMEGTAYTYMVECGDGSLYTGWTNHLTKRIQNHNQGKGAKYTRSRLPVHLVYYEVFATRQEAMQRECAIKKLHHKDKLQLIGQLQKDKSDMIRQINETLTYD